MYRRKILSSVGIGGVLFGISVLAGNGVPFSLLMAAIGAAFGVFLPIIWENRRRKKEKQLISLDLADYLMTVSLLLEAGLTLWDAMKRATWGWDPKRPLFKALNRAFDAYENGNASDQIAALEEMAEERQIPAVSTFVSAVVQHYRKGNRELAGLFSELAENCRQERRWIVSELADEATTLLLIPSTMALIVMILVLAAPAVLQLLQF